MKKSLIFVFIFTAMLFLGVNAYNITYDPKGIKVYIPPKNVLSLTMKHAFMDWQRHTNNKITFEYVGTESTADIEVIFVSKGIGTICGDANALGCNRIVTAKTLRGNDKRVDSKLYISMTNQQGQPMSKNQAYTIMLHEVGHSLGLAHSQNKTSIMYESTNRNMAEIQEIRKEDIENLYKYFGI